MSIIVHCQICNKKYRIRPSYFKGGRMKTCSRICGYKSVSQKLKEENNGQWKGNGVGYTALHNWIKRRLKKPELCEECHKKKSYDLTNISGEYKRDLTDWRWLCRACHMDSDGRKKNLLPGWWKEGHPYYPPYSKNPKLEKVPF